MDIAIVATHPGNPARIVAPDKTIKIPAQTNSSRREILNTLQNKKKCPIATAMIKLAGQNVF